MTKGHQVFSTVVCDCPLWYLGGTEVIRLGVDKQTDNSYIMP